MGARWMAAAMCCAAVAGLAAANFWESKPYTEWSPKEVEAILGDSPWTKKVSIVVQRPPRPSDDGGGRGGGDGLARGFPIPDPQLKMTLTWRSARPVREALSRLNNGDLLIDGKPLAEQPEHYLFTLSGVPANLRRSVPDAAKTSFLKREGKTPIPLLQGGIQPGTAATLTLIFAFPRTDPIVAGDKEVEFVTTIGTLEIKQKFKLKDLTVGGELAL